MKKLILDKSKWICGVSYSSENTFLGIGNTALLNSDGFMCCLGQFSKQLNPKITDNLLLDIAFPSGISSTHHAGLEVFIDGSISSELSQRAAIINDHTTTTIEEKIEKLKELFAKYDFEIEVIN